MGYWIDGALFVKRFDAQADVKYPDNGCNVESYCNHEFIELEFLENLQWWLRDKLFFIMSYGKYTKHWMCRLFQPKFKSSLQDFDIARISILFLIVGILK